MCGIAGIISNNNSLGETKSIIQKMMNVIKHRGPDDSGIYQSDYLTFGHNRLSIIDIDHGQQPMSVLNGAFIIVFNGEIYNYLELRQQLIQKGYKIKSYSDTEVLLYMYVEYKEKLLDYINGMFAFAIFDKKKDHIFIARDHFGIKPLYYSIVNDSFIFSSEIKSLLQYPEMSSEVDYDSLNEYLTFQFVLKEKTLFKNIYKLEPATYLKFKKNKLIEKKEYWKIDYHIDDSMTESEYADNLLVLLENSALLQTRSDVPIGAYLSGGLDSSIVATLANKNYMGKFKTFSGAFRESEIYDETKYAKVISDSIDSDHYTVYPSAKDFINNIEKLIYFMDEPAAGPGLFPQYMVSKKASEKVKVVLGGQGGDEIFGGYARYAVAYLEQCIKGAIFETQEEGKHIVTLHSIIKNMPVMKQYIPMIRNQFAEKLFGPMDERYFRLINRSANLHKIYKEDFLKSYDSNNIKFKFQKIFNKVDTLSYFNKMTHFDLKTMLPALLQVEDRMSMAVSIESRVPLLDKRIVELAAKIPPPLKFAGGKIKYMLIQSVRNILPAEIINRKDKMGFPTPFNEWLAGPLKEFVLDIFNCKNTKERGLIDTAVIEKEILTSGKFSRDLWGALCLEIWFKEFIDR